MDLQWPSCDERGGAFVGQTRQDLSSENDQKHLLLENWKNQKRLADQMQNN